MMNPRIQASTFQSALINTGQERVPGGKPHAVSLFCDYAQRTEDGRARSGTARGDPKRLAPYFIVEVMGRRSRGDPGG